MFFERVFLNREDAFQKDENTYSDIRFEEACILYNIGAIYSKLGAIETRRTHEVSFIKNLKFLFQLLYIHSRV